MALDIFATKGAKTKKAGNNEDTKTVLPQSEADDIISSSGES